MPERKLDVNFVKVKEICDKSNVWSATLRYKKS